MDRCAGLHRWLDMKHGQQMADTAHRSVFAKTRLKKPASWVRASSLS
jgi:hypothetical protein